MIRPPLAAAILLVAAGGALAAGAMPSLEEAEQIILRDVPRIDVFRTSCEGMSHMHIGKAADGSEFDYDNPFRVVVRFPPATSPPPSLRTLARVGLMVEEPGEAGGMQFRFTEQGWLQMRPGNGLCLEWGTHDQMRVIDVVPEQMDGQRAVRATYVISYSSEQALERWAQDPQVRGEFRSMRFYYPSQKLTAIIMEKDGRWATAKVPHVRALAPPISDPQVLELARQGMSELAAMEACFPLPGTRPQLGIEAAAAGGYSVTVHETPGLNRTQTVFIEQTLMQLEDMRRSGIFEKGGPRIFRLSGNLQPYYRKNCIAVGTSAARLAKVKPQQWYDNDAWFKIMLDVKPDPNLVKTRKALLARKDVRLFLSRGTACEGWLKYRKETWKMGSSRCYPAY